MEIIRMIYDGDYFPADHLADKSLEIREAREKAYKRYEAFKKKLDKDQIAAYEKVMESQGTVMGLELREAFVVGARAGGQMLADLLMGG